ncbi:MAG: sulfotransferase [Armatimonadetes bacterium]|jgi:hypothetical protein|nr:sulfotransferase [Armatimonadota bacterium]
MHVFCVGMYRSCSTWQYQVASHLVERYFQGRRLGFRSGDDYAALTRSGELAEDEWAVLKSHEKDRRFAHALAKGRALGLYAYRDVRDVVDSLAFKLRLPVSTVIQQGLVHRVLANDRYWRTRPRMLIQRYRVIVNHPAAAVAEIAVHLGLHLTPDEAAAVAEEYSLEANRRRTAAMKERMEACRLDAADPANHLCFDAQTLLHWNHLRRGDDGGWRTGLEPRHLELVGRLCGTWLIRRGYESDRSWMPARPRMSLSQALRHECALRAELAQAFLRATLYFASLRAPRAVALLRRALGRSPLPASSEPLARPAPEPRR